MRYCEINEAAVFAFKTAKGSIYNVYSDGTTARYKTYHAGHGAAEVGDQSRSQVTFYVSDDNELEKLAIIQSRGGDRIGVAPYGKGVIACRYISGPNAGKFITGTLVNVDKVPAVGKYPIE